MVVTADVQGSLLDELAGEGQAVAPAEEKLPRLTRVRRGLTPDAERDAVLGVLRDDLVRKLDGHVVWRRRELVETFLRWEDKYGVSFRALEAQRAKATGLLNSFLKGFGHEG